MYKEREGRLKNVPKFIQQKRILDRDYSPEIEMDFAFKRKRDGSIVMRSSQTAPIKDLQHNEEYEKLYEIAYIKVKSFDISLYIFYIYYLSIYIFFI